MGAPALVTVTSVLAAPKIPRMPSSRPVAFGHIKLAAVSYRLCPTLLVGPTLTRQPKCKNLDEKLRRDCRVIVSRVALDIPAGRKVAISGRSGCGKSVLMKLICRLYRPSEGSITIDGVPLDQVLI
jgi:ABC-type multidrug transport system fused ATPase/permease subunit